MPFFQRVTGCYAAALLLLATLLGACAKHPPAVEPTPAVAVLEIKPQEVSDDISAAGTIEAVNKTQLGFMVAGRVRRIEVEDGATVVAGQLIAELDGTDYRQQLAIAEAKLTETRAHETRLRQMHDLGSLTATDLDKITAAVAEVEATTELARRHVGYTKLHAPFAGRITRHAVSEGTVVAPGTPVCTLIALAPVWATLSVPEGDATRIAPGQAARVRLASMENVDVSASVESVLPQADPVTRTFAVKLRLENADLAFRPGNVVTAWISPGPTHSVITIPPSAVQHFPDGALFVWIVDPTQHTVTRRIVSIGRTRGTEVEVTAGLVSGERIVTAIAAPLFDGMKVSVSAR
jgi:RND family efflux transporter MFP subunit